MDFKVAYLVLLEVYTGWLWFNQMLETEAQHMPRLNL